MKYLLVAIFLTLSLSCSSDEPVKEQKAESENEQQLIKPEYEQVIDGLDIIWGLDWLPNGDLLASEKAGVLYLIKNNETVTEIGGLPDDMVVQGQGGFMDVTVDPDYENNGWIYFSYASSSGGGSGANTAILRARLEGNELTDKKILYKGEPNTGRGQHFGSRIAFDNDNLLYFSIGDRGARDLNPQDIYRDCGKIYRINRDGSVPESNPFVNEQSAVEEIFSFGHRNPQGMELNPFTGEIWAHEHGPKGGDEINIIRKGENYGWPEVSYGVNYDGTKFTDKTSAPGMKQPIWYWVPSIAPSGMAFVDSDKYSAWQGDLLVGSLKFGYIMYLDLEDDEVQSESPIFEGIGRVRAIEQGPDGFIYFSVEGKGIFRIKKFD